MAACVCWWRERLGGDEDCDTCDTWIKLCILPPERISYIFLKDIPQKQVTFQMIKHGLNQVGKKEVEKGV